MDSSYMQNSAVAPVQLCPISSISVDEMDHLRRLGILSPVSAVESTTTTTDQSIPHSSSSSSVSSSSDRHTTAQASSQSAIFVPPLNFAIISPGVYRSGFPRPENYQFLDQLGLKTMIYLADQDFKEDTHKWATKRGLNILHFRIDSNKEPLVEASRPEMAKALMEVINGSNYPILLACNRGKHRVGLLSALIRRLQGWSLTMTFDEYKRFFASTNAPGEGKNAGGRVGDYEWIETFDLDAFQYVTKADASVWLRRPI